MRSESSSAGEDDPGLFRPPGLRHGYHARLGTAGVPGLGDAGDQWAGSTWAIGAHRHTMWELYLQLDGTASRWRVGRQWVLVGPRQLLLVPPGVEHELAEPRPDRWHFHFASLDPAVLLADRPRAVAPWSGPVPLVVADATACVAPFVTFLDHVTSSGPLRPEALRVSAQLLLITVADQMAGTRSRRSLVLDHPAIARAVRLIRSRYAEDLRVADLAAAVGLSTAHFAGLFTSQVGIPPATFRRDVRLAEAHRLLRETTLSVSEISACVGFSSGQHLATVMRQVSDTVPSDVRRASGALPGEQAVP